MVIRVGLAVVVTMAASRARRWTWLVLAGLAAVGAERGGDLVLAGIGVAAALLGSIFERRRIIGAISAAASLQVLLRLPDLGFLGASVVFAVAAVAPVVVSGYLQLSRVGRRRTRRAVVAVAGVCVLGTVVFGLSVLLAWNKANHGVQQAKDGLSAVAESRSGAAVGLFDEAEASLHSASGIAGAWWAAPARLVPVVAQQSLALATVTGEGAALARSAGAAARGADVQSFKYESGQIDLARMQAAQEPLDTVVVQLEQASGALGRVSSPWLVAPVAERLDRFSTEVDRALDQSRIASLGMHQAPGLFGGEGTRHYFVLFTQPAEARGLGGFVGSWALLTASGGRVELTKSGRAKDINDTPGRAGRSLTGPTEYLDRYGRFRPAYYFQDVTFSPDFASVAQVVRELYPQAGGVPIDGVLAVDPEGMASLLKITGPVSLPEHGVRLSAETAAKFLMQDQYIQFADRDRREAREDLLEEAGRVTFDKLVKGSLPSPKRVGDILGPAVAGRHLMFQSFRAQEQRLFSQLGAGGTIDPAGQDDYVSLVTQNKGNNKIDVFMHRSVDYHVTYDPVTGKADATATVKLRNDAPSSGLPESVIGSNDQGLPLGTNELYLSFYSPYHLKRATIDGEPQGMEYQREFGYAVYSRFVTIPSGATVTVVLELDGRLGVGPGYQLRVGAQPVPNPDTITVAVDAAPGSQVRGATGLAVRGRGTGAAGSAVLTTDRTFLVGF